MKLGRVGKLLVRFDINQEHIIGSTEKVMKDDRTRMHSCPIILKCLSTRKYLSASEMLKNILYND